MYVTAFCMTSMSHVARDPILYLLLNVLFAPFIFTPTDYPICWANAKAMGTREYQNLIAAKIQQKTAIGYIELDEQLNFWKLCHEKVYRSGYSWWIVLFNEFYVWMEVEISFPFQDKIDKLDFLIHKKQKWLKSFCTLGKVWLRLIPQFYKPALV